MWYLITSGFGLFGLGLFIGWRQGYRAGADGNDGYYRGWHAYRTTVPNQAVINAQAIYQQSVAKQFKRAQWWHGKYAIVKHENNQLRRKLFKGIEQSDQTD